MSSNKLSHDEFIKRAKISNPNLLILGTYTRAKDKIKYKCTVCGNFIRPTEKNKANTPDKLEIKKFCKTCGKTQVFKEKK